ncbi:DUF1730 domain-containing protein [Mycoplasmatota bacterium WC44]
MLKEKIEIFASDLGLIIGFADYSEYEKLNNSRFKSSRFDYAKSIISIGYPISKCDEYNLASFALDKDYHIIVKEKLRLIKEFILKEVEANIEFFCDDGPIDDKLCAYLSGIGHYGKNSLIINKDYGSYIMLGELVLDIDFDYSEKIIIDCGNCNLCELKCPNSAMDDIYKKCLTGYLQRKDKNSSFEYSLQGKIYGCDICQSVCPKNKQIIGNSRYLYGNIDIRDIIRCSKNDFKKYKDTAFYWLGHNLMKRNAIIFAANNGIDISEELKYVNSKEEYMMKAINYYNKLGERL